MSYFIALTFVVCAALAWTPTALGRTVDRCSLARELSKLGVPKHELPTWVCIAQHESNYRTDAVGKVNKNGTRDYGIFQINNKYWCQPADGSKSYNQCKLSCNALLTDNIRDSVHCAQLVKKQQGWTAWATYKYCQSNVPGTDNCF